MSPTSSSTTANAGNRTARTVGLGVVAALVAAIAAWGASTNLHSDGDANTETTAMSDVSGVGEAVAPPWALPTDVSANVGAAGLDMGPMGMAEHYHAHLDVFVGGNAIPVPANIGVDPQTGAMSALHTHTPDGIVHVEADKVGEVFTLGQLFTQWDVLFDESQLGSLTATDDEPLKVYVNGEEQSGNPALLRLSDQQQISIVFGSQDIDIPTTYDFRGV